MKKKIRNWLETKLGKYRGEHSVPQLLDPRPHVLTPSCSTVALTPGSPFFEKLPPEIRREILTLAFGGRTVHMDLSYGHPAVPGGPELRRTYAHNGMNIIDDRFPPTVVCNTALPKSWQWWGSVCHRLPPGHRRSWRDINGSLEHGLNEPGGDFCRFGRGQCCPAWPGEVPFKCWIGAMGWLLSCRQA